MSKGTIITAEDLRAAASPAEFAQDAVGRHMQSEMYRNAVDADEYYRQRNVTISRFTRRIATAHRVEPLQTPERPALHVLARQGRVLR